MRRRHVLAAAFIAPAWVAALVESGPAWCSLVGWVAHR